MVARQKNLAQNILIFSPGDFGGEVRLGIMNQFIEGLQILVNRGDAMIPGRG